MKAIFGILSLVIVLAIVGSIAKKQLQAVDGGVATRYSEAASRAAAMSADPGARDGATQAIPGGVPGAIAADPAGLTVPQQSRNMQEKVRADTVRALEQGVERNRRAEP
ncbi:MAG: hypothetical protein M3Z15_08330 [Pseudomonadota bacterium]|nr:hypothetical protein [Pseudomonadota bacterium]